MKISNMFQWDASKRRSAKFWVSGSSADRFSVRSFIFLFIGYNIGQVSTTGIMGVHLLEILTYFNDIRFFLLVKVPQIVKILQSKSAEGINVLSVLLDLFAITAMVSYSFVSRFPFR